MTLYNFTYEEKEFLKKLKDKRTNVQYYNKIEKEPEQNTVIIFILKYKELIEITNHKEIIKILNEIIQD